MRTSNLKSPGVVPGVGPPAAFASVLKNCRPEGSKHPGGGRIESPSKSTTLLMWRLLRRTHFSRIDFLPLLRKGRKWILEEWSLLLVYPRIWEGEGYRRSEILNPTTATTTSGPHCFLMAFDGVPVVSDRNSSATLSSTEDLEINKNKIKNHGT